VQRSAYHAVMLYHTKMCTAPDAKHALSGCKTRHFSPQYAALWHANDGTLEAKVTHFAT